MDLPTPQSLVDAHLYANEADVLEDAMRHLLRARPELQVNLAVHRYATEAISLAKAAQIAGVSWHTMRDILRERGIMLRLGAESVAAAQQELAVIEQYLAERE